MSNILGSVQLITTSIKQTEMDALRTHHVCPMLHKISQACLVSAN